MRWLTNFYDLRLKRTATAAIGIHPTKAWLSQLVNFKNAIRHFRRTRCNKIMFLSGIWDSRNAGSLRGMMRGVGGGRKSIHQSWLTKGLGLWLGLLCWGFKGVQEEIPSEEASTLQIGSVAFPTGQYTSPQLHPCHRLFDQDGHQNSSSTSLKSRPCSFPKLRGCRYETIETMKESVTKVIDTHTQEDFHWAFKKLLERYNKCIVAGGDYFEGV